MRVKKRDGRIVDFNPENIKRTIQYAAQAVEVRDLDFQTHAEEFNDLVKQLMKSGVQLEEARDLAEDQISGYILDGVYTEFDGDEADEVVDFVVESLDSSGKDIVDVELIQDIIENALISTGHKKTAKEYITRRAQRDRARDMNSRLMKSFEGITFKNSIDNDTKRENANIDGDSAMGTMLKYGSESAKEFNLLYLVSPDIADAHRNGDIHIHDLDFAALTETCVSGDTMLVIKDGSSVQMVRAREFDKYLDEFPDDTVIKLDGLKILSKGEFVDLKNCVRHSSDGKRVLKIATDNTEIVVTSEHKIPVLRDGIVTDIRADEIKIGDTLLNDYSEFGGSLQYINLIDAFENKSNVIIYNSDYVLDCIKKSGNWKKFCSRVGYNTRGSSIRYGHSKLTVEEYILYVRDLGCVDESKIKLAYKRTRGSQTIDAVLKLTKELGKFMGYMFSEGSIGEYESYSQDSNEKVACFVNQNKYMIEDFNNCVRGVFDNAVIRDRFTGECHSGTILSGYIVWELFHGPLGIKNGQNDISLPDWVYSANREFLDGLISALIDGDGCIQKDGYRITYTQVCEPFIHQLQMLLTLNGIRSYIKCQKTQGTSTNFGDTTSIRNFDCFRLIVTTDCFKLNWLDSIKVQDSFNMVKRSDTVKDRYYNVTRIEEVNDYEDYVYDFETENHYFQANGVTVHNCVQIDLLKLFKGGFNTGHGFLREPQDIRTAGALACIAIQSSQNDMHSVA